jgi:hypothetical protein
MLAASTAAQAPASPPSADAPADPPQPADAAAGVLMVEHASSAGGRSGVQVYPMSGAGAFDAEDTSAADSELAALQTPVMVLDEIDAGIGPRLGSSIGRMLHAMATGGQTLCVSHVPQVRLLGA